jgi:hypothetical protein
VVLPTEHGGWSFLAEPAVLGLALAPSPAGACLALAALAGFLARHPLRLVTLDRRRGARHPRTALAGRVFAGFAGLSLLLAVTASALASAPFWLPLVVAAPVGLVALAYDALGRSGRDRPRGLGLGHRPGRGRAGGRRVGRLGPGRAAGGDVGAVRARAPPAAPGPPRRTAGRPPRPQVLGLQEVGYGLLTLVLLAVGYRAGL